jgi:hypothetical protein
VLRNNGSAATPTARVRNRSWRAVLVARVVQWSATLGGERRAVVRGAPWPAVLVARVAP